MDNQNTNKKNTNKKISVYLSKESSDKLKEAKEKGYTTTQYINNVINNAAVIDINAVRNIMLHIGNIQTILEFETDDIHLQKDMREELHKICQCLKSLQAHT